MNDHDEHEEISEARKMLRTFVVDVARESVMEHGWDTEPQIALVFQHHLPDSAAAVVEARELNIGQELWSGLLAASSDDANTTVATMLRASAMAVKLSTGSRIPYDPWPTNSDFVGAMLITETWAVSGENTDRARLKDVRQWLDAGHKLSDHPDAYEAKLVVIVDTNGLCASCTFSRKTSEVAAVNSFDFDDIEHPENYTLAWALAYVTVAARDRHREEQNA